MNTSTRKRLLVFAGVAAILLIVVLGNLNKKSSGTVKVQTDTVQLGEIIASVSGAARIQPEVQVKVSAKVSGQIIKMDVKEGDTVKRGQFLVQLDRVVYEASRDQAQSNLNYAKAGYEKAKNEYIRAESLYKDNLTSKAELEIAKSTYEQASAQVDQAQAALDQAVDDLNKTTIYSTMDGVVSQLNKKVGEMAMGSQFTLDVIMVVADLSRMQAETEIDENDVVSVSLGDTARIEVDAFPDTIFLGVVTEIANTGTTEGQGTQEEVTNFLVKVAMLQRPASLRPGMSATVDILTDRHAQALKVPIQCVTVRKPVKADTAQTALAKRRNHRSGGVTYDETAEDVRVVFVVKEGVAHQVEVKTGISSDSDWEILSGVAEGDEVVSGSYRVLSKQLKHKDAVTVDNTLKKYGREDEDENR